MRDDNTSDKQLKSDKPWLFQPGQSGNPKGRPKRKTLTELIHAKLDDTPEAWEAIVATVMQKILKDKDKDILKTFWNYTDGLPKQSIKHEGDLNVETTVIYKPHKKHDMEATPDSGDSTDKD